MKNYKQFCKHFGLNMDTGVAKSAYKEYTEVHLGNSGQCEPIDWSTTKAIKEEKNPMARNVDIWGNVVAPVATVEVQTKSNNSEREYLLERLSELKREKIDAAWTAANKPRQPHTWDQLVAAITGNKFTLDQKRLDVAKEDFGDEWANHYNMFAFVKWTDYTGFDSKTFEATKKAINVEHVKAKDTISVMDPTAGLAALQAFDAFTYTAPATA